PVLSNILMEAKEGSLQIMATDLEVGVIVNVKAEVSETGKICVLAKSLYDIIKELPDEEIKIKRKDQNRLEIIAKKSHFKIVGLSHEEFPNLPLPDEKNWYRLDAMGLKGMFDKTMHAISSDESRYNLHGVYFEKSSEKSIRVVATDGHRLCYVEREVSEPFKLAKGVIIPKKAVVELRKLVGENASEDPSVALSIDGRNLVARRGEVTLVARLVDGDFPDYQRVIPKPQDKSYTAEKALMMGALRRVSLLVNDRTRGVRFSLSSGLLELSASNPDLGEAREELPVDYKSDHLKVGFNARYFLDVLGTIDDEKVTVEVNGEVGPCVIRSSGDKGFLSVIMPMRI
ncbi:MAG: DNA polymerase III subunit beta, partial [Deltaproteobacteria bacterium]|nr:DNA polymerase III subunit beta [Deltaproteobacteria bacterium]